MNQAANRPETKEIAFNVLLISGVLLLPGLHAAMFGWLYAIIPLLVFYYLCRHGNHAGSKYLISGTLLALTVGIIGQRISNVLFALTLYPTGYILAQSAKRQESPGLAGFKGILVLCASWVFFFIMVGTMDHSNPYEMLLQSIDQAMDDALKMYQANGEIPVEIYTDLTAAFHQIKQRLIQLLPAILVSGGLSVIWLTMVAGNRLLALKQRQAPWPAYQHWRLSEKFVWFFIFAAILALIPGGTVRTGGLNLLMIGAVIYGFQGLSIVLFFFNKWNIPLFMRTLLYLILIFQTAGSIILSVIGLIDVWYDFRKKSNQATTQDDR